MTITTFEATSAELLGGAGENEREIPGLSYRVRLAPRDALELTTGERFADLEGRLVVYPETDPRRAPDKPTGFIAYLEACQPRIPWGARQTAPSAVYKSSLPTYLIQVWLPRVHFDYLVSAAQQGRIPSRLDVDIDGVSTPQADGNGKQWNNKASQHLKVTSFRFTLPFFLPASTSESERSPSEEGMSPTRTQFDQLIQRIDIQMAQMNEGLKSLLWVAIILGLLFLWLRWKG